MGYSLEKRDYIVDYIKKHHHHQNQMEMAYYLKVSPASIRKHLKALGLHASRSQRKVIPPAEQKVAKVAKVSMGFVPKPHVFDNLKHDEKFCLVVTDLTRHKEVSRIYLKSVNRIVNYVHQYGEDKSYNLFPMHQ